MAEFERNGFQDYLGFRPDLMRNRLHFVPALPAAWKRVDAVLPFGLSGPGEAAQDLLLHGERSGGTWVWTLRLRGAGAGREIVFDLLDRHQARQRVSFLLQPGRAALLQWKGGQASLDGRPLRGELVMASQASRIGALRFAQPPRDDASAFPMTRGAHVLRDTVLRGEYR